MFANRLLRNCTKIRTNLFKTELITPVGTVNVNNLRIFCSETKTHSSTIYALSSGHGKCGVAVVRISGPHAQQAIERMTKVQKLEPRRTFLKKIYDPNTEEVIDKGLCIWFPGPASFTGEDSVEFQVHGGLAIVNSLFSGLSKLGFRQALPGEFTRRAFLNKKLDLTEIEGLADLIHAETEQQRRQALLQADGCLSKLYNQWSQDLLHSVAALEAFVDFSEDDNIEDGVVDRCNRNLKILRDKVQEHLSDGRKGEILRTGARTIILGEPNVGKSSLLNSLAQRNAAIVTPIAGTTRDIVELSINVSGYPIVLADTAGLTESTDVVEKEGIQKARSYAKQADLIILMMSATELAKDKNIGKYIQNYVVDLKLEDLLMPDGHLSSNCCVVVNKMDLIDDSTILKQIRESDAVAISCEKQELSQLTERMKKKLEYICGNPSREHPTLSQARHRQHLEHSLQCLDEYFDICSSTFYDMAIANQKIRDAMYELNKITGHVSTEQVLDVIFKQFCIGK